jgi:Protein kinase domain/AAA ATPase domain
MSLESGGAEQHASDTELPAGELISQRFRVEGLLGRGGTGCAYRVRDETNGQLVALKLLEVPADARRAQLIVDQFEREFNLLVDLAHPRVVQASDYGLWNDKPFYILELLDGGDLQSLAPLPWQDVCSVAYDICSALSLLHSRRLVHRDITPRNIRRTTDGRAKLLDFGLLAPMGVSSSLAGTPPFVAPEVVARSALDARSDLFSLGCTLYFALTRRACFPARAFAQLAELWRSNPPPPSQLVPGIPRAVDDLVMELIRIEPSGRPKSAAEVMDRLLPLLPVRPDEELSAARSYLSTPQMVGRTAAVNVLRERLLRAHLGHGGGFVLRGASGIGLSRLLNTFVIEAKLVGATALRASAIDAATGAYGVAAALASDLVAAHPATVREALRDDPTTLSVLLSETPSNDGTEAAKIELRLVAGNPPSNHFAVQTALRALLLRAARENMLAIAVDDAEQIDHASAALLATLSWDAPRERLVYAIASNVDHAADPSHPLAVLAQHAEPLELQPLTAEETHLLLESVFGDVPHLNLLSRRLHDISAGRPRDTMALAQHLVDTGTLRYAGGSWTLPAELPQGLLPAHMEEALERRVAQLTPLARRLGLLVSLSFLERLSRAHWLHLEGVTSAEVDRAVDELQTHQCIVGTPLGYALCHATVGRLFGAHVTRDVIEQAHRDLARVFTRTGECTLAILHHLRHGRDTAGAIECMQPLLTDQVQRLAEIDRAELELGTDRTMDVLMLCLAAAQDVGRPPAELQLWRAMIAGMCARGGDATHYYRLSEVWLAQLKHDSGFDDWHQLPSDMPAADRIQRALAAAGARHQSEPLEQRGSSAADAIRQLIGYVVISIAVGVRTMDIQLQRSLPALLEPFASLSPLAEAMLWNARATCFNGEGKRELARETFVRVLGLMDNIGAAGLLYLDKVRAAIQQTVAEIDASLGVRSEYIARLDDSNLDPNQRVGAHYIKLVVALNDGDTDTAERHRRDAELLGLQTKARSMFSTLGQELEAHAAARNLTGLKRVRESIASMARQSPGWIPVRAVADAEYARVCGDLTGAFRAVAALRDVPEAQRASPWCLYGAAIEAEILTDLRRPDEALQVCEPAWAHCDREGMRFLARRLGCALALTEAGLRRFEPAAARIEGIIAELEKLGVTGLQLSPAYEVAVRIAVESRNAKQFARCARRLLDHQTSRGIVTGRAYEQWVEDARRAGLVTQSAFAAVRPVRDMVTNSTFITRMMTEVEDRSECAQRAIDYLCQVTKSPVGHLFLRTVSGLEWVASAGDDDAVEAVSDVARQAFEAQISLDHDSHTLLTEDAQLDLDGATQAWVSQQSDQYSTIVLRVPSDSETRVIGIAMLGNLATDQVESTWLASALAIHLAKFCDEPD